MVNRYPPSMTGPGLREAKKLRTRRAISDVATRLFVERGFDAVTVTDVAREAGVAPATVFNYFGTKEELLFDRAAEQRERLVAAIGARPTGASVASAFRAWHDEEVALLTAEPAAVVVRGMGRAVEGSETLRRHLAALHLRLESELAAALDGAAADDVTPALLAAQLAAVHRHVVALAFRLAAQGVDPGRCRAATAAATDAGFALLSPRALAWGEVPSDR
jgi:AcrR family transcriptional regulator